MLNSLLSKLWSCVENIDIDDKQFEKMAAVAVSQAANQLENPRDKALQDYRKKILEHKEIEGRLKESK